MKKIKNLLMLSLVGFLMFTTPAMTSQAAWKTTENGKIYTQSAAPGYVTGLKKIGSYYYYFDKNGIMQTGFHTLNDRLYFFRTTNGRRITGWFTRSSNGKKYKYYADKNGVIQTGLKTIDKKMYYFSAKGVMQKGWIITSKGRYYANKSTGVLYASEWVNNYYFQANGLMATNTWIDGKWVGANGKYTGIDKKTGWITENNRTYFYSPSGKIVKGWMTQNGKTYYLHPSDGALQTGWFSVSGRTYYADPETGMLAKSKWVNGKYLKSNGVMATGLVKISGKKYYFNSSGVKQTGWETIGGKKYYFNSSGVMKTSSWVKDRYVNSSGVMVTGWQTIGDYTYYFKSNGNRTKKGLTIDGKKYYFHASNGRLYKNRWLFSNRYYAGSSGALLKGLNAISGSLYYFDTATYKKVTSTKKKITSDIYYFKADGAAARNMWVKLDGEFYYFKSTGKMAVSQWVGNYYVNEEGIRTDGTGLKGWQTINGKKFYFDKDGKKVIGWQTINSSKYYFDETGAMATGFTDINGSTYYLDSNGILIESGIQTIGGRKYYFYSDGRMARDLTIAVGAKQYTINSEGVIMKETSIKIDENSTGSKIVNYALQFVGNPYVYGGTSLTNGADCSGFVMTVFSHFGYKLMRVANDQMHGPSQYYVNSGYAQDVVVDIDSIQPGDLLFYGSNNYATHVAIYMGNGQIVHASNSQPYPKGGIKISNHDYNPIIKAVRYWS